MLGEEVGLSSSSRRVTFGDHNVDDQIVISSQLVRENNAFLLTKVLGGERTSSVEHASMYGMLIETDRG